MRLGSTYLYGQLSCMMLLQLTSIAASLHWEYQYHLRLLTTRNGVLLLCTRLDPVKCLEC